MKNKLVNIFLVAILLVGLSLLLYPFLSDYWNSFHQSRAIAGYSEEVELIDEAEYEKLWKAAETYNESLIGRGNHYLLDEEQQEEYDQLLNISGTGIMGYVEIPVINCALPIYHGTEESVLQIAAGHLDWTSLPVGGESTHCVLSGHRGLPSAKLFTDLDDLAAGDVFMLRVLNEVLTYEVDQILIVEPHETEALHIEEGKDYCTLVTCTPYAKNTHRLLVRGHRIENAEAASTARVTSDAVQIEPLLVAPLAAVPMLLVLLIVLLVQDFRASKKRKRGGDTNAKTK